MRTIILAALLLSPMVVFCQADVDPVNPVAQIDPAFEKYCLENALTVMEVASAKSNDITYDGTVPALLAEGATYLDYQLTPIEGRTQYFQIQGTNKVLALKSLYSLRLNYSNAKK